MDELKKKKNDRLYIQTIQIILKDVGGDAHVTTSPRQITCTSCIPITFQT